MTRPAPRAFTLIEIVVVVAIISVLALISVANMEAGRERAIQVDCDAYRGLVEQAEVALVVEEGQHSADVSELLTTGMLTRVRHCRAGGHYAWIPYPPDHRAFQRHYGCSIHDWPAGFGGPGMQVPQAPPQATPQPTTAPSPGATPQLTPQLAPQPTAAASPTPLNQATPQPTSSGPVASQPQVPIPPQPVRPGWIPPGLGGTPPGHGGPHGPHDSGSGSNSHPNHGNHFGQSKH